MDAAVYMRMSSLKQDESIEQQEKALTLLATEHKYNVVRTYPDPGWSGDDAFRPKYTELLSDVQDPTCPFQVLLVWDLDRLSRSDSLEVMSDLQKFKKAGIAIHSHQEGYFDLTEQDIGKLILLLVKSDQNRAYLTKLAPNVVRGLVAAVKAGRWPGGPAPYGYILDHQHLIQDNESGKDKTVQWIYRAFVVDLLGYSEIAAELNSRRVAAPDSPKWTRATIKNILTNEKYVGDIWFGKNASGRHVRIVGDRALPLTITEKRQLEARREEILKNRASDAVRGVHYKTKPRVIRRNKRGEDGLYIENAIESPLIDRQLWNLAQIRVAEIAKSKRRLRKDRLPLSDIAICGHCGAHLFGLNTTVKRKLVSGEVKIVPKRVYRCSRAQHDHVHKDYSLPADYLHSLVLEHLGQEYLTEKNIRRIAKQVVSEQAKKEAGLEADLPAMEAKVIKLEQEIARQEDLATEAPKRLQTKFVEKLTKLDEDLREAKATLEAARYLQKASSRSLEDMEEEVFQALTKARTNLFSKDPQVQRRAFLEMLAEVKVWMQPKKLGKVYAKRLGKDTSDTAWALSKTVIRVRSKVQIGKERRIVLTIHDLFTFRLDGGLSRRKPR